jgi:hypothetical protein
MPHVTVIKANAKLGIGANNNFFFFFVLMIVIESVNMIGKRPTLTSFDRGCSRSLNLCSVWFNNWTIPIL